MEALLIVIGNKQERDAKNARENIFLCFFHNHKKYLYDYGTGM
jgi:hypothetical protein